MKILLVINDIDEKNQILILRKAMALLLNNFDSLYDEI